MYYICILRVDETRTKEKEMKIYKKKNFEGYIFNCANCGREIKHAYHTEEGTLYGSECIYNLFPNISKKQIKNIDDTHKLLQKILNNKNYYS